MFSISYAATSGTFFIQPGSFDGTSGWTSNDAAGASYVNEIAPDGPTRARKVTLKEASQLVLKARGVGDLALDIIGAGAPTAAVATLYCFSNGPDQMCHCSKFSECSYKIISDGAAAKLVCRNAAPDPLCNTAPSTTTTTSPVTTTTVFDQCGGSAFPVCGAPCSGDEVCSPFFAPASLGGNQCACVPPEPCGGTTPGVCPPGSACALLPPGPTFFCAPLECSGGADFPACGGSCAAGLECRALQVEAVGDGFCVCAPAAPCDSACGGYDCAPGDVCTRDLAGTCSCGAP
jgi:hypothetical protein